MSILDELMKAAFAEFRIASEDVDAYWERSLRELGNDDLQYIRARQLDTELRSSTPEHYQRMRAEHTLTGLEEKARPLVKKVLPILFAIEEQKRRVEKIKSTEKRQTEEHAQRQRDTPDREFLGLIALLIEFGVSKHKVRQLGRPEAMIMADLMRWKAEDPKFRNESNPWRDVLRIYANRTVKKEEPGTRSKTRSLPGPPPAPSNDPRRQHETQYWRFDGEIEFITEVSSTDQQRSHNSVTQGSAADGLVEGQVGKLQEAQPLSEQSPVSLTSTPRPKTETTKAPAPRRVPSITELQDYELKRQLARLRERSGEAPSKPDDIQVVEHSPDATGAKALISTIEQSRAISYHEFALLSSDEEKSRALAQLLLEYEEKDSGMSDAKVNSKKYDHHPQSRITLDQQKGLLDELVIGIYLLDSSVIRRLRSAGLLMPRDAP